MAKEKAEEVESDENKFSIINGFQFGIGFFLAQLVGLLAIGLLGWLLSYILRATGVVF